MRRAGPLAVAIGLSGVLIRGSQVAPAQLDEPFSGTPDHAAIEYRLRPARDPVATLNGKIANGEIRLTSDSGSGYARAALAALGISADSQLLVFSKTGVQGGLTGPSNPRALLFNDTVVVGYIRAAPLLEVAAQDPQQGMVFYTLDQSAQAPVRFQRQDRCLTCHHSFNTLDVPGVLVRSQFTAADGTSLRQLGQFLVDHRTPFEERWGGYYVTSAHPSVPHMGNLMLTDRTAPVPPKRDATLTVASLAEKVDTSTYAAASSDIVALMVFDHQMRMMNLLTRIGWEVRVALFEHRLDFSQAAQRRAIEEVVDYLLFVEEAPFAARVEDRSPFAVRFSSEGPRDRKGRSLREFDLQRRLFRYPCSYMINAPAFDGLPREAKAEIYRRLWSILSGRETGRKYARLTKGDRQAIVEILRDTQASLPASFSGAVR